MKRFISPPRNEIPRLRTPLTPGEQQVFEFLDKRLDLQWEIYIQPHLNGLRPDFVLLNPRVGIAVFEVKDWNLDAMSYKVVRRDGKSPKLVGSNQYRTFSLQAGNPVERVFRYKNEIYELYCPRLQHRSGFAVITAGIIFPFAQTNRVIALLDPCLQYRNMLQKPEYNPVSGQDALESGDLERIFPEGSRRWSKHMNDNLAKDFRNWLIEPDFSATQRMPLELDENQRRYVTTRTRSGYRRLKGPAGSGKSVILAARAAELASEGKDILVVTYNITLTHYLMDVAVRWTHGRGNTRANITWLNFHSWCKRVCKDADHYEEYRDIWRTHFDSEKTMLHVDVGDDPNLMRALNEEIPSLVSQLIDADEEDLVQKYDAILVDEGQDFLPNWWNVLRKVCRPNGEMLLVADATQDIYGTARSWTDEAMIGAGFSGDWARLSVSYRLPPKTVQVAKEFAAFYLPQDLVDLPESLQGELDIYPCRMRWIQIVEDVAATVCRDEILNMPLLAEPTILAIPDITFLAPTQAFGLEVVKLIGNKGVRSVHTFSEDQRESRRLKMGFYMGDARVKATTLHSFKGWETRALVIYTGHSFSSKSLALLYTGLTRTKRHTEGSYLTVVCATPELAQFGKKWPEYAEKLFV